MDRGARVLVVDDEQAIRRFLRVTLDAQGYQVYEAETGKEALDAVPACRPDALILDLGLPDMEGHEVIRRLREWSSVPIIVLSVREHETEKIAALDAGADDYLTKPFASGELMARLRAAVRRAAHTGNEPVYEVGDLRIDLGRRQVTLAGNEVSLTPTEHDLLRVLAQHAGRVLTHHQLLRQVWGASYEPETHLLRVNISNLRRKLEADPSRPQYIVTEPGVGYRLRQD
ncbi:MAG: response regulator transcription factor [Armatimonadetes bacterium]|nr:response regulator transcription factor [Armatimonadota bacterium]